MTESGPDILPDMPPEPGPSPRASAAARRAWWRRRWVTIGEVVAIAALSVAVLGYLDAHRERRDAAAERRAETAAQAQAQAARTALVLTGAAAEDGARLTLAPMSAGQAVQSQRYLFPKAVLDHAMEVSAAQPQIDRAWIDAGLVRWARAAAGAPGGAATGEGRLPVGIETTYIEDGAVRTDRSLYEVGFRIEKGGLFSGPRLLLQGLSVGRRGVAGDLQQAVEARWAAQAPRGLAAVG